MNKSDTFYCFEFFDADKSPVKYISPFILSAENFKNRKDVLKEGIEYFLSLHPISPLEFENYKIFFDFTEFPSNYNDGSKKVCEITFLDGKKIDLNVSLKNSEDIKDFIHNNPYNIKSSDPLLGIYRKFVKYEYSFKNLGKFGEVWKKTINECIKENIFEQDAFLGINYWINVPKDLTVFVWDMNSTKIEKIIFFLLQKSKFELDKFTKWKNVNPILPYGKLLGDEKTRLKRDFDEALCHAKNKFGDKILVRKRFFWNVT